MSGSHTSVSPNTRLVTRSPKWGPPSKNTSSFSAAAPGPVDEEAASAHIFSTFLQEENGRFLEEEDETPDRKLDDDDDDTEVPRREEGRRDGNTLHFKELKDEELLQWAEREGHNAAAELEKDTVIV